MRQENTTRTYKTCDFKILIMRMHIQCIPGSSLPPRKTLGTRLRCICVHTVIAWSKDNLTAFEKSNLFLYDKILTFFAFCSSYNTCMPHLFTVLYDVINPLIHVYTSMHAHNFYCLLILDFYAGKCHVQC